VPTDDTPPDQRGRPADIAATVVPLIVHGLLLGATVLLLGLFVMGTDPRGSVKCGDPRSR